MCNILDNAIKIATLVHEKEIDKAGKPYILHPLSVMKSPILETDKEKSVGVLHDVLESEPTSIRLLLSMRMPEDVIEAVKILTRDSSDTYAEYINKIANSGNLTAIKVKLADLNHNSSEERMIVLKPEKASQLNKRYSKAKSILEPLI